MESIPPLTIIAESFMFYMFRRNAKVVKNIHISAKILYKVAYIIKNQLIAPMKISESLPI